MSVPVISVILPVFNREFYVREAIQSILNQTFPNFELLVIDDASTDNTLQIVKSISDPRIKTYEFIENKGVASAINKGLKEAKGRYIVRADSDDININTRFHKQLKVFQDNPQILVCGSWINILGKDILIQNREFHGEILIDMLSHCALSMGTSMWDHYRVRGLYLTEGMRFGEDYEFWSRLIWKGEFYNIQEPLIFYRVHEEQLTRKHETAKNGPEIRLTFFKRLNYSEQIFSDEVLVKVMRLKEFISLKDFHTYFNWLKNLKRKNKEYKIFPLIDFEKVVEGMREDLIFKLYFKQSNIGIGKIWRLRAIRYLSLKEIAYILTGKIREYKKIMKL